MKVLRGIPFSPSTTRSPRRRIGYALMKKLGEHYGIRIHYGDVGALGGVESHWRPMANLLEVTAYEPNEKVTTEIHSHLNRASEVGDSGRYQLVNAAVGAKPGSGILKVTGIPGLSSMLEPKQDGRLHGGKYANQGWQVVTEQAIEIVRLDTDLAIRKLRPFDYLKIDTEGFELEVLTGYLSLLSRTKFVQLEVSLESLRDGDCSFFQVDSLLRKNGFRLLRFKELGCAPVPVPEVGYAGSGGFLVAGDALYMRDAMREPETLVGEHESIVWIFLLLHLNQINLAKSFLSALPTTGSKETNYFERRLANLIWWMSPPKEKALEVIATYHSAKTKLGPMRRKTVELVSRVANRKDGRNFSGARGEA